MGSLRNFLREQIQPSVEQPWRDRVSAWMKAEKQAAEEHAARLAQPPVEPEPEPAKSLPDQLRELIGRQDNGEHPALNSEALLQIAAGTPDAPRSVREEVAGILRGLWDSR